MKFKYIVKELAGCIAIAGMIFGMALGAVKINAAGADTELPELYQVQCEQIGQAYGICPELLMAIIEEESGGNPDAVGFAGEIGLMQVDPKYHTGRAESLGVYNLFNPKGNILVGADYLAELLKDYQDIGTALMVYNGSCDAEELGEQGEYTEYAEKIMKRSEQLERLRGK